MQNISSNYIDAINAQTRVIRAKADLYNGEALIASYTQSDAIKSIDIQRVGEEGKFFGFGVTHKINIKLIDVQRIINLSTTNHFKISLGVQTASGIEYAAFPKVYITEVNRDENTNELSITAYDVLEGAKSLNFESLGLVAPYTIKNVIEAAAAQFGANAELVNIPEVALNVPIETFSGDTWTSNGIVFTKNSDGSLTLNGTNDGINNSAYFFYNEVAGGAPLTLEVGETYTASDFENEDIMFVFFTGEYYRKKDGQTFEATEDEHVFSQVYIQIPKGNTTTFENYTIYPSLKKKATLFENEYDSGANFEGTEALPEVLKAAAEATGTIYFINSNDNLVFKMLDRDGEAVKTITKANYIDLDCKTNRRLQTICNCTELGDNVSISTTEIGTTQYVRDNPFLELRGDITSILENLLGLLGNLTINQFECSWRGDGALEPADKIGIITKDNQTAFSFLLNDSISFNGGLGEETSWTYTESEETESNPSSLGAMLKQTYARVDKANKQIDIVASETSANSEAISTIQLSTETINVAVQNVEKTTSEALENVNNNMNELTSRVEATMTAEDVSILINSELQNGTSKVTTSTGFTFDEGGLNISKTGSEMSTNINEDGMIIQRDGEDVLNANHEGVNAYNLHAKTYLIVGESSRFEDYEKDGETRTGCFWIGGAD